MLTKDREKVITLYIEGNKITDIAKIVRVSRQTIYSWLNEDEVKAELDKRKQDLANRGNQLILKDITTYIDNIKALASNCTDNRVKLAANQYLLNRVYGNPTNIVQTNDDNDSDNVDTMELANELENFKRRKQADV